MLGEEEHWRSWGDVLYSVKAGRPAFDHVYGVPHFQYFARHPEVAQIVNDGMTSRSGPENDAIVSAYDFSGLGLVVDVGGGKGALLAAIIEASAETRGLLYDVPHVIAAARADITGSRHAFRWTLSGGDFLEAVPGGGDAYILKKVIHDWDDD